MPLNANALTTLAKAKAHCGVLPNQTVSDTKLEMFINAASAEIETYCDRKFVSQTETEYLHGRNQNMVIPKQWPITAITGLWVDGERQFGSGTEISNTEYFIEDDDTSILYTRRFPHGYRNIKLTYTYGYTSIPSNLELACLWLVEWYYRHNDAHMMGRSSTSKGDENTAILTDMPPMIQRMLNGFKRTEFNTSTLPMDNS